MRTERASAAGDWLWSQPAILSVPATDTRRVGQALARGTDALAELLKRFAVTPADVAARLSIRHGDVERPISEARPAPAVMLDGEDAARGSGDEVATALAEAIVNDAWRPGTLRLVRIASGQAGERQLERIARELSGSRRVRAPHSVVLAKVARPGEVREAVAALRRFEDELALESGSVGIHLLIETSAGLESLTAAAEAAGSRLAGLLFGALDYAADAGLPDASDHAGTALAWARARLANAAAAAGVPALDGMTTLFPPPANSTTAPAEGFLAALEATYRDTLRAAAQGMAGKLVGHPAQLLAVLLAFGQVYSAREQARWSGIIDAYEGESKGGAMTHGGQMIDEASVRHARTMLDRASAAGYAGIHEHGVTAARTLVRNEALR